MSDCFQGSIGNGKRRIDLHGKRERKPPPLYGERKWLGADIRQITAYRKVKTNFEMATKYQSNFQKVSLNGDTLLDVKLCVASCGHRELS